MACELDPPCPHEVVDVAVYLNPLMPDRQACLAHILWMVDPLGGAA